MTIFVPAEADHCFEAARGERRSYSGIEHGDVDTVALDHPDRVGAVLDGDPVGRFEPGGYTSAITS